jgi:hypothetical protein
MSSQPINDQFNTVLGLIDTYDIPGVDKEEAGTRISELATDIFSRVMPEVQRIQKSNEISGVEAAPVEIETVKKIVDFLKAHTGFESGLIKSFEKLHSCLEDIEEEREENLKLFDPEMAVQYPAQITNLKNINVVEKGMLFQEGAGPIMQIITSLERATKGFVATIATMKDENMEEEEIIAKLRKEYDKLVEQSTTLKNSLDELPVQTQETARKCLESIEALSAIFEENE